MARKSLPLSVLVAIDVVPAKQNVMANDPVGIVLLST